MDHLLPPAFIAIAALALCFGLYAIWQSLRALFAARLEPRTVTVQSERERLVDQKASLIKALRELRSERDLGKISDQDYDALDARYRAKTKKVLRDLDAQLGGFRKQAQTLLDGNGTASPDAPAPAAAPSAESDPEPATTCPDCGTDNDVDAVFCKQCGRRRDAESLAEPPLGEGQT